MGYESIDGESSFWGSEGVNSDGRFQELNKARKETEQKHNEGFVGKDVRNLFRRQREMFNGESRGVLKRVEPPVRTFYFHFCLEHCRNGDFLLCAEFSGPVF